jgi:hypothetical protein
MEGKKSNGLDRINAFLYITSESNVREHHSTIPHPLTSAWRGVEQGDSSQKMTGYSSVSTVTRNIVQFPETGTEFSLLHSVETGSEAYPA